MLQEKFKVNSLNETINFATDFAAKILELFKEKSKVTILLYAEMGAGKTTITREFGKALGIQSRITSPTFVGLNHYDEATYIFDHFDLYQVGINYEDLNESLDAVKNTIFVFEWAENMKEPELELLKKKSTVFKIDISVLSEESREIKISEI